MLAAASSVKSLLKPKETSIDNTVFKLHYQLTCGALMISSIIASTYLFFGDPITCMSSLKDEKSEKVYNNYCWAQSTFTLPDAFDKNKLKAKEIPHLGIDHYIPDQNEKPVYHSYYQWVCFFLFFQAISFYIPHFIWKTIESGKIKSVVSGLGNVNFDRENNVNKLAEYLEKSLGQHWSYAAGFLFGQILNFINVVGEIYLTNVFLGGQFLTYGIEVLQQTSFLPMTKVFPRVTKCTFRKFGPSGDVQSHDLLCVLPINIVNEKIFIFLWFWFIILAILTGLNLIYYIFLLFKKNARWKAISLRNRFANKTSLKEVTLKMDYGDWFLMYMLNKNINYLNFNELIDELHELFELGHLSKMSTTELLYK